MWKLLWSSQALLGLAERFPRHMEVVRHLKRTKVSSARWKKRNLLNVITVSLLGEVNFHVLVTYCMETSCASDSGRKQPFFTQCMYDPPQTLSASGFCAFWCQLLPCTSAHSYTITTPFKSVHRVISFLKIIVQQIRSFLCLNCHDFSTCLEASRNRCVEGRLYSFCGFLKITTDSLKVMLP